jgi:hypothetical protein
MGSSSLVRISHGIMEQRIPSVNHLSGPVPQSTSESAASRLTLLTHASPLPAPARSPCPQRRLPMSLGTQPYAFPIPASSACTAPSLVGPRHLPCHIPPAGPAHHLDNSPLGRAGRHAGLHLPPPLGTVAEAISSSSDAVSS